MHPLSRFHCMLSTVLKNASSKHMYCVALGVTEWRRTMLEVSCTVMDCWRLTAGELVGNAPALAWSPNMLPKQLPRGAPLQQEKTLISISLGLPSFSGQMSRLRNRCGWWCIVWMWVFLVWSVNHPGRLVHWLFWCESKDYVWRPEKRQT